MLENYELNITQACHAVNLQRCVYYYRPKITPQIREQRDMPVADKLRELSQKHNKRGFGVIFGLMRNQGILVNHKRAYRIYSELVTYGEKDTSNECLIESRNRLLFLALQTKYGPWIL